MDARRADDARADEAVFRVARIGGRPGAGPRLAVLAASAVAGLALIGILGGGRPAPGPPSEEAAAPSASPETVATPHLDPAIAIRTRAWGPYVYVQGRALDGDVELLVVSIRDPGDRVMQVRAIRLDGAAAAAGPHPAGAFRLAFEVTGVAALQVATVHVAAYDDDGLRTASTWQPLKPAVDPGWWRQEGGDVRWGDLP